MPEPATIRYRFGNIEVDPGQRCVRKNGQEEHPRARVFDLLLYLIENRSRPISKQELVERVWDTVVVTDSVLYKTILEVRRTLCGDDEDCIYVRTLPKLGYQFVGPVKVEQLAVPGESQPILLRDFFARWKFPLALAATLITVAAVWIWKAQAFAPPPAPDQEIAWWRFAEGSGSTVKDSAGQATGRLVAAPIGGLPPHRAPGLHGAALSINGGNFVEGQMKIPEWSALTVSAWVRPAETNGYDSMIFDSSRLALFLVPNGVMIGRPGGVGVAQDLQGKWHHLVAVDEGPLTNVGRIFLDGVEMVSGVLPKPAPLSQISWRIGQSFSRNAAFRGLIEDLRVYARPLRKLEIQAIYGCGKEQPDLVSTSGTPYYYLPVFADGSTVPQRGSVGNSGMDFGGIQFAAHGGSCDVNSLRGADLGQDIRISVDAMVTRDDHGHSTEAGPYFRSRPAYPGDGIVGGASSGYWLKLYANGQMRLWQLRPFHIVAASPAPARFDTARFHRIETIAKGVGLRAWLDGVAVDFEQDGRTVQNVEIEQTGPHRGTAGIAFSAESNRGSLGGQQARNVAIETLGK